MTIVTDLQAYIKELDNEIDSLETVLSHYDDVLPSEIYRELDGLKGQHADTSSRLKSILAKNGE